MPTIIIDEGPGGRGAPPLSNNADTYNSPAPSQTAVADISHFQTPPGWIKLGQIVLGAICIFVGPVWLTIVAYLGILGTIPWCFIYLFQINKRWAINPPWIVLEFYFMAVAFAAYAVMSLVSFITIIFFIGGIFGLLATLAYGAGAYFLLPEWKAWRANPVNSATSVPK